MATAGTSATTTASARWGMAAAGILSPPAALVEPLIAVTIAFVAIENLFFRQAPSARPIVVFAFGLLHGLGFAGFFGELGLPPGQFWSALIGFNIGVEIGQLLFVAAILGAGALLRRLFHASDGVLPPGSRSLRITAYAIGTLSAVWMWDRVTGFVT